MKNIIFLFALLFCAVNLSAQTTPVKKIGKKGTVTIDSTFEILVVNADSNVRKLPKASFATDGRVASLEGVVAMKPTTAAMNAADAALQTNINYANLLRAAADSVINAQKLVKSDTADLIRKGVNLNTYFTITQGDADSVFVNGGVIAVTHTDATSLSTSQAGIGAGTLFAGSPLGGMNYENARIELGSNLTSGDFYTTISANGAEGFPSVNLSRSGSDKNNNFLTASAIFGVQIDTDDAIVSKNGIIVTQNDVYRNYASGEKLPISVMSSGTPTSSTVGKNGQFMFDADYLYIYVNGDWKKVALSSL